MAFKYNRKADNWEDLLNFESALGDDLCPFDRKERLTRLFNDVEIFEEYYDQDNVYVVECKGDIEELSVKNKTLLVKINKKYDVVVFEVIEPLNHKFLGVLF